MGGALRPGAAEGLAEARAHARLRRAVLSRRNRGARRRHRRARHARGRPAAVARPDRQATRRRLDRGGVRELDAHERPQRPRNGSVSIAMLEALQRGDFAAVEGMLQNDFHDADRRADAGDRRRHRGAARRGRAQRAARRVGLVRFRAREKPTRSKRSGDASAARRRLKESLRASQRLRSGDERRRPRRRSARRGCDAAARRAEQSLRRHRRHDAGRARRRCAACLPVDRTDRRRYAAGRVGKPGSAGGRRLPPRRRAHSRQPAQRARGLCSRRSRARRRFGSAGAHGRGGRRFRRALYGARRRRHLRMRRETRASAALSQRSAHLGADARRYVLRRRPRGDQTARAAVARTLHRRSRRRAKAPVQTGVALRLGYAGAFCDRPALDRGKPKRVRRGFSAHRCARSSRRIPRPASTSTASATSHSRASWYARPATPKSASASA